MKEPLSLNPDIIAWKLGQSVHDLAYREAIMNADELLRDKRVTTALDSSIGSDQRKQDSWLGWASKAILGEVPAGVPVLRDVAKSAISDRGYEMSPVARPSTASSAWARISGPLSACATSLLRRSGCVMLSRRPAISSACQPVRRLEQRSSSRMWQMVRRTRRRPGLAAG
jgi:hypothetical protein